MPKGRSSNRSFSWRVWLLAEYAGWLVRSFIPRTCRKIARAMPVVGVLVG